MNLGTEENLIKVVLDTNVLISAILFGGNPAQILYSVIEEKILAITSPILTSELKEVFNKKFSLKETDFKLTFKNIDEIFITVQPKKIVNISRDGDDNRVLEAAFEGGCSYIITGDKDLLDLKIYKNIKIVTPEAFLSAL